MESIRIIGFSILAAIVYGVLQDQITARICVEYFTIGHPPVFQTNDPTVLAFFWGTVATWWVGLVLGVLLAIASRAGTRPKLGLRDLWVSIGMLMGGVGVLAALAGVVGYLAAAQEWVWLAAPLDRTVPPEKHVAFLTDAWVHLAAYGFGFLGAILLCVRAWKRRGKLIYQASASVPVRLDPHSGARLYTVWYGTNRKPKDPNNPSKGFAGDRDERVHYGTCDVSIPRSHEFGSVGSSFLKRWIRRVDDRLTLIERKAASEEEFWASIVASLNECDLSERQALVYLHGYNVDFDEAAIRAAQIGYDLKFPGVMAFYSWPSAGTAHSYPADEATIEANERFIADFLSAFLARIGAERVHLIAHSMGNRGLLRALLHLSRRLSSQAEVPFGQVILAAPDIDRDVFVSLADVYSRFAQRTTLYASECDAAVRLSRGLHKYDRVGLIPPVTIVNGIDTVKVPRFEVLDLLGHGYYAEAEGLLYDIADLLTSNTPPDKRQRLTPEKTAEGLCYWAMYA